jgi:hypothetical protein
LFFWYVVKEHAPFYDQVARYMATWSFSYKASAHWQNAVPLSA